MRVASDLNLANPAFSLSPNPAGSTTNAESRYADYKIIRRNGSVAPFQPDKIAIALTKAFLAVNGGHEAASARMRDMVQQLTSAVVNALLRHKPSGGTFHIEEVQDQVELALMRGGAHEVARSYVLYREKRTQERAEERARAIAPDIAAEAVGINVSINGGHVPLDVVALSALIESACEDL